MSALSDVHKRFHKRSAALGRDEEILKMLIKTNSNVQSVQDQLNDHKMEVAYHECLKMNQQIIAVYGDNASILDCASPYHH